MSMYGLNILCKRSASASISQTPIIHPNWGCSSREDASDLRVERRHLTPKEEFVTFDYNLNVANSVIELGSEAYQFWHEPRPAKNRQRKVVIEV